jgi:hypothetical protein
MEVTDYGACERTFAALPNVASRCDDDRNRNDSIQEYAGEGHGTGVNDMMNVKRHWWVLSCHWTETREVRRSTPRCSYR